ncbi:MAG: MFS transporter [Gammaproteobacteria bacterium]|nr:MFS transporter [Gammaproteobacteria bacterium]MBU2180855.1 MFS transporter [Gammaproteobacteria bacterium]MBU2224257.1 MFS transporter [Gammaproteobacteria bacterium]MBU2280406.1 MFS transporter [Gammaproteobacteria bacterium]
MLQQTDLKTTQHYLTYVLLAFVAMSGLSYINFLPGMVNALAGGIGFSDSEAGQIVALNGYGGLLGSTIAIFLVRRIRWQPVVVASLSLLAGLDIATAWLNDVRWMLGWRFFAGAIGGLALGLAVAQLARLENPDRAFGALLFVQFSIGSLVMVLLPSLEVMTSAHAVFHIMAFLSLLSLLVMLILPTRRLNSDTSKLATATSVPLKHDDYLHAVPLLFAIAGYQMAASAIWAYVGLIGIGAAITNANVNSFIAITGLLGLLGAVLPIWLGRRFGRLPWLMAGVALSATAAVLLNFSQQYQLYVLAMALLFFSWPAVQSYLLAVTAEIDNSGRLSTIATLVSSVGLATGPLLASVLLENNDFSKMLYSCAVIFGLSYLLLRKPVQAQEKPPLLQCRQHEDSPQPSSTQGQ